jgi:hypothetical protein
MAAYSFPVSFTAMASCKRMLHCGVDDVRVHVKLLGQVGF